MDFTENIRTIHCREAFCDYSPACTSKMMKRGYHVRPLLVFVWDDNMLSR
jgi:hypothetical protein